MQSNTRDITVALNSLDQTNIEKGNYMEKEEQKTKKSRQQQGQLEGLVMRFKLWWHGHKFNFVWVHCNGESSKTSATIASYHHPLSITWRWAIYWHKSQGFKFYSPENWRSYGGYGKISTGIIPIFGGFSLSWQPHMFRGA